MPNMPVGGRVLAISHETDSHVVASALRAAMSDPIYREIALHACTIDEITAPAFIELLRHEDREWDSVEFINCRGQVETAITLALSTDTVQALNLVRNIEMVGGFIALGIGLQASTSIKKLRLTSTVQVEDATALAEGLRKNQSIESIDLRWCNFEPGSVTKMANGLAENRSLQHLDIFGCSLEDDDLSQISLALCDHSALERLVLNGNKCGLQACKALAKLMESEFCGLKKLDLSFQRLDAGKKFDVSPIASALTKNTTLQSLDLTCNLLNDEDAVQIADALCKNSTVKELFLARNKFTNTGITSIAKVLPQLDGLKKLSLWGNPFGEDGALALLNGMARNMEIHDLHLFQQFKCSDKIQYFANINRGGRKLLQEPPNNVPLSLWPLVLERANNLKLSQRRKDDEKEKARVDMIYCLLRGPVLLARGFFNYEE